MKPKQLEIIHQEEQFVVINKAATVLSIPDGYGEGRENVKSQLEKEFSRVLVVHRLDGETSGVMVFALEEAAHRNLSLQFESHAVQKIYYALVEGEAKLDQWEVSDSIGEHPSRRGVMKINLKDGKQAFTSFRVLEKFRRYALVEATPQTGRTHQIRVHLSASGLPIVADKVYGSGNPLLLSKLKRGFKPDAKREEKPLLARLGLHAVSLSFNHPISNERVSFQAHNPKDFDAALTQLRKNR